MAGKATGLMIGAAVMLAAAGAPAEEMLERRQGALQALDKITARVSRLEMKVGATESFGRLRITLRACRESPPLEPPESAAFLEIREQRLGEVEALVFSGWMFGSSPALSALEHPVYDIWVLACHD